MPNNDGSIMTDIINLLTEHPARTLAREQMLRGHLYTQEDRQMDLVTASKQMADRSAREADYQMGARWQVRAVTQRNANQDLESFLRVQEQQRQNLAQPVLDAIAQKPDIAAALKAFQELQQGGKNYVKDGM